MGKMKIKDYNPEMTVAEQLMGLKVNGACLAFELGKANAVRQVITVKLAPQRCSGQAWSTKLDLKDTKKFLVWRTA